METIDTDLPCAQCGYNLRTLAINGVCPECGEPVRASELAADAREQRYRALRVRGTPWLQAVRGGLLLYLAACASIIASEILLPSRGAPTSTSAAAVYALPAASSFVVIFWAMWLWFAPGRSWISRVGRAAIALSLAAFLASQFSDRWVRFYFGQGAAVPQAFDRPFYAAIDLLGASLPLAVPLTIVLAFGRLAYLCRLARRRVMMIPPLIIAIVAALWLLPTWPGHPRSFLGMRWWMLVNVVALGLAAGTLIAAASLAYTFTRAILLGELPAASSRSLPAPRPPA